MAELKPCPFCGGEAKYRYSMPYSTMMENISVPTEKGKKMAVAKKVGYFKPYTHNSKADQKRNKPFGTPKKGKAKK